MFVCVCVSVYVCVCVFVCICCAVVYAFAVYKQGGTNLLGIRG